ncbi:MAG: AAA family ATPase [Paludibacterium sp.]|uniref:AAA family ATPase n=1 Tax=Paludibacterium sp. TaxID=1917523 RepID=UPI0025F0A0D0|nr:AAA family ATPase [Paludibacterium sp.]MBV8047029.1 AAA family ATPase [Paludibacterium sp.]MBV8648171.1 AAA family ATPase [Paludibacterium sp.]
MSRFVVISGYSGGGKSTLLAELNRRGYRVVEEPAKRIVSNQLALNGALRPWFEPRVYVLRTLVMALEDIITVQKTAKADEWVFFDRSWTDSVVTYHLLSSEPLSSLLGQLPRNHHRVFLAPPWPEIQPQDATRWYSIESATAEYTQLLEGYPKLGYDVCILPKTSVAERADFVLHTLGI